MIDDVVHGIQVPEIRGQGAGVGDQVK